MLNGVLRFAVPIAFGLALVAGAGRADDRPALPPDVAPPFTATYHFQRDVRSGPAAEWKKDRDETVTLTIDATRSRWDFGSDGTVKIVDSVARAYTITGGKMGPKLGYRVSQSFKPIGWEFGYKHAASPTDTQTEVLGTTKIAGRDCTRIRLTSDPFGAPEFCVAGNGVVLRFANETTDDRAVYEATSVTDGPVDPSRFTLPPDVKIEDRASKAPLS